MIYSHKVFPYNKPLNVFTVESVDHPTLSVSSTFVISPVVQYHICMIVSHTPFDNKSSLIYFRQSTNYSNSSNSGPPIIEILRLLDVSFLPRYFKFQLCLPTRSTQQL